MRRAFLVLIIATALAAGCKDSTEPERFPNVSGSYDYNASVSGLPSAAIVGTLGIVADDDTGTITGAWSITISGGGQAPSTSGGQLTSARVTEDGDVLFDFNSPDYRHVGRVSGRNITGTWILSGGTSSFTGSFTAIRR